MRTFDLILSQRRTESAAMRPEDFEPILIVADKLDGTVVDVLTYKIIAEEALASVTEEDFRREAFDFYERNPLNATEVANLLHRWEREGLEFPGQNRYMSKYWEEWKDTVGLPKGCTLSLLS